MPVTLQLIPADEEYTIVSQLDGRLFRLRVQYQERNDSFVLSLETEDGVVLCRGNRVSLSAEPFKAQRTIDWPPGRFTLVDRSPDNIEPTEGDLGERVELVYFSESEIEDLQAAIDATVNPGDEAITIKRIQKVP